MRADLYEVFKDGLGRDDRVPFLLSPAGAFSWTRADLRRRACAEAAGLARALPEAGGRVLLQMDNTPEAFTAFAAIVLAGACPVIADQGVSPEDAADICGRLRVRGVVAAAPAFRAAAAAAGAAAYARALDAFRPGGDAEEAGFPVKRLASAAYITFSSGTTGKPKAVAISHANVASCLESMGAAYALAPDTRHLCVMPVSHASGLYRGILLPFAARGSVVLAGRFEAAAFWRTVGEHGVGFVQVVPAILSALLSEDGPAGAPACLRLVGSASAHHPRELVRRFEERFGVRVAQGYGLTEITCGAVLNHPLFPDRYRPGAVGKAMPGVKLEVVDEAGAPLPPGRTGEIVISGPMVADGYLQPAGGEGKRFERGRIFTEDLGVLDEDGFLVIQGRKSEIIHRAGFNVSPTEVEDALLAHPDVRKAIVFSVPHEHLGEDIIACVDHRDPAAFREHELRRFLAGRFPQYKVPSRIVCDPAAFQTAGLKPSRKTLSRRYQEARVGVAPAPARASRDLAPERPVRAFKYGDVVYLRPMMKADTESREYLDNIMDPEVQYMTYSGRFPQSEMEIRRYWEGVSLPGHMSFAICDSVNHEHVGNIALRVDWVARIGEFGRMIFKRFQHKNYSFEAMRLLMEYAFDDLRLTRLWGGGANPRSLPSLFKLGFTLEGRLREHHFLHGEWRDQFAVGILRREYEAIRDGRAPAPQMAGIQASLAVPERIMRPLKEALHEAFFLPLEEIRLDTSPVTVPEWNSLGVVVLWSVLEDKFSLRLSSSDFMGVRNVADLAIMLEGKSGHA